MAKSSRPNRYRRIPSIKWVLILRIKKKCRRRKKRGRRRPQRIEVIRSSSSSLQRFCRKGGTMNNNQQQRSFFFNVDWLMVFLYLILCAIGVVNIHSAVFKPQSPSWFDLSTDYGKQILYVIIGSCVGIMILLLDSRFFSSLAPFFYGIT